MSSPYNKKMAVSGVTNGVRLTTGETSSRFNFLLNHLSRFSFCALATLALLGRLDAVDTDATASFVASCMNFDGGFGSRPGAESHAGLIYTCVGRWL